MKKRIIQKTIEEKMTDWLFTLPDNVREYVASKLVVTGGCIASMFLREPVNDYDVYFKNTKAVLMVTQHYCKEWIKSNECQQSSARTKGLVHFIRVTYSQDATHKSISEISGSLDKDKSIPTFDQIKDEEIYSHRSLIHPEDNGLNTLIENGWQDIERVEIFVRSAGFVGENPDEDYDYFENREVGAAEEFIDNNLTVNEEGLNKSGDKYRIVFMSSNAITLSDKLQIVIRFFGDPSEIHATYDFIHATNYYTKKTGLVTNTRALEALLARELIYAGSKYPLASIFRTRKFIKREWTCHVGNFVKMAMQLNEMDLSDPDVLEEQLTGVDAAYLYEIIKAVKDKRKDDPTFEFNSTYICTLVDRFMGESGQTSGDMGITEENLR